MTPDSNAIYLDFHASTPIDPSVAESMCEWLRRGCGNPHSAEHAFGWAAHEAVERAREAVAALIRADAEDIVFTSGATEANNLALFGVADLASDGRDTILVSAIEHASILEPARALQSRGFRVVGLPVNGDGRVQPDVLERALSPRVLLVSVGAVNNEVGSIQDLHALGSLSRSAGALFHTDAAQALTARELPLGDLPVDFASLSSHKAYGPAGVGALYVAPGNDCRIAPQVLGGAQQRGLRAGTLPAALCVGFGRACEILRARGAEERLRVAELRAELWCLLKTNVHELELNGPKNFSNRHPGNLAVAFTGLDARDLIQCLQPDVACSSGSACHSGSEQPSHVLMALGYDHERARASVRFSLGRQSTRAEIERAVALVAKASEALRFKCPC